MEISIILQIHVAISIRTSPFFVYYVYVYLSVPKTPTKQNAFQVTYKLMQELWLYFGMQLFLKACLEFVIVHFIILDNTATFFAFTRDHMCLKYLNKFYT